MTINDCITFLVSFLYRDTECLNQDKQQSCKTSYNVSCVECRDGVFLSQKISEFMSQKTKSFSATHDEFFIQKILDKMEKKYEQDPSIMFKSTLANFYCSYNPCECCHDLFDSLSCPDTTSYSGKRKFASDFLNLLLKEMFKFSFSVTEDEITNIINNKDNQ